MGTDLPLGSAWGGLHWPRRFFLPWGKAQAPTRWRGRAARLVSLLEGQVWFKSQLRQTAFNQFLLP